MNKMIVKYDKNFRMKIENNRNSEIILTDRNGEMLSPSELLAASVASCAMTVLSIRLESNNQNFENCYAEVGKTVDLTTFKVTEINIAFHLKKEYNQEVREKAEKSVEEMCVVGRSLSKDVRQNYSFIYDVEN